MKNRVSALPVVLENFCNSSHSTSPRYICLQCRYRSSLRQSPTRTSLYPTHASSLHRPQSSSLRRSLRVDERNYANDSRGVEKLQDGITNFMKKRLFKEDPTPPQKPESPQPQPDTEVGAPISTGPTTGSPPDDVVEGGEAVPPHRRNPSDDPSYIPAASSEGLEMIGGLTGWWENAWDEQFKFRGFNRPTPVLNPDAVTQAISRTVVEIIVLKEPSSSEYTLPEPRPDGTAWDDLVPLPKFRCWEARSGVIQLESKKGKQDWIRVAHQLRPSMGEERAIVDDSDEVPEEVNEAEEDAVQPALGEEKVAYRLRPRSGRKRAIHHHSHEVSKRINEAREEVGQPTVREEKVDEVPAHNDAKLEKEFGEQEELVPNPAAEEDTKIERVLGQQKKSVPNQVSAQEDAKVERELGQQEELVPNPAAEDNIKVERELGKLEESVPDPAAEDIAGVEKELGEEEESVPIPAAEDGVPISEEKYYSGLQGSISLGNPRFKFAVIKRTCQLLGQRLPDPVIQSITDTQILHSRLIKPPPAKKLHQTLRKSQQFVPRGKTPRPLLSKLPNVRILAKRQSPGSREEELGRQKIVKRELLRYGIPVPGSQTVEEMEEMEEGKIRAAAGREEEEAVLPEIELPVDVDEESLEGESLEGESLEGESLDGDPRVEELESLEGDQRRVESRL